MAFGLGTNKGETDCNLMPMQRAWVVMVCSLAKFTDFGYIGDHNYYIWRRALMVLEIYLFTLCFKIAVYAHIWRPFLKRCKKKRFLFHWNVTSFAKLIFYSRRYKIMFCNLKCVSLICDIMWGNIFPIYLTYIIWLHYICSTIFCRKIIGDFTRNRWTAVFRTKLSEMLGMCQLIG